MLRQLMVSLLSILFSTAVAAAGTVSGIVVNADTQSPLAGATVAVSGGQWQISTDEQGRFEIITDASELETTVSYVGFETRRRVTLEAGADNRIPLRPTVSILNSIVVTASRHEKAAFRVSQPITTATREDIIKEGNTLVSDIIRTFPGIDMNDAGPFRTRPVIRGVYGTRVLVLVDGKRLNDHRDIVDFGGISMSLIDAGEIDRVEVVNGPSSVLYGSDAMGGVINVITGRNRFSEQPAPWASYGARYSTADRQSSNRLDLGLASGKLSVSGGIMYREADRDYRVPDGFAYEDPRYGVFNQEFYDSLNAAEGTDFSSRRIANSKVRINNYDVRVGYRLNERHRLDADLGVFRASDIGFPGVPNDSTPFLFLWPNHDRDNFSVTYTGTGLSDNLARLRGTFYYEQISKDFLTDFYDNVSFPAGPGAFGFLETTLSSTEVKKYGLNLQELHRISQSITATFGIDAWREEIDGRSRTITRFEGFGPFPVYDTSYAATVPENRWHALGVYGVGEFIFNKLQVGSGVRFDAFWVSSDETGGYVDGNGTLLATDDETYQALNGSLGLVYPLTQAINAVADIGTAYRVPNVVERYFYGSASGRLTRPNPAIKPERAVTVSSGIKAVHPHVDYSLIGFYSYYSDFTQLQTFGTDSATMQPLWRYENVDDVTIYGAEALIEARLENGLYGHAAFSVQHGDNNTDDEPLFVSPVKVTVTGGYRFPWQGLFGEVTLRVAGDQNRVAEVSTLDDIPTDGYAVVSASVGIDLYNRLRLSISGRNLFDEVYSEPFNGRNPDNPLPEPGRSFTISLNTAIGR